MSGRNGVDLVPHLLSQQEEHLGKLDQIWTVGKSPSKLPQLEGPSQLRSWPLWLMKACEQHHPTAAALPHC